MKEIIVRGFIEVYEFQKFNKLYSIESLDSGNPNGRFKICYG